MLKIILSTALLITSLAYADVLEDNEIDMTQPLSDVVVAINTYISDNNITTGTTTVSYAKGGIADVERHASDLLHDSVSPDDRKFLTRITTDEIKTFSAVEIAYGLAVGNAFALDNCPLAKAKTALKSADCVNLQDFAEVVSALLKKMGGQRNVTITKASASIMNGTESTQTMVYEIYNKRARESVNFFIIEGTM